MQHEVTSIARHHIDVPDDALASDQPGGRVMFLPGSMGRARNMASRLARTRHFPSPRGHDVWVGEIPGASGPIDVGVCPTGMGCPSVDIIVTELLSIGASCLLRVGTSGSFRSDRVPAGDVVIATAAVRDEATSNAYAPPEFPAVASPILVRTAREAATVLGIGNRVHSGIVHTKDSLHAREFGLGPQVPENTRYMTILQQLGVLASEMEAAHLFVLAHVYAARMCRPVHAGCVLAVLGGHDKPFSGGAAGDEAQARAIDLAFATAAAWPSAYAADQVVAGPAVAG